MYVAAIVKWGGQRCLYIRGALGSTPWAVGIPDDRAVEFELTAQFVAREGEMSRVTRIVVCALCAYLHAPEYP